MLRLEWLWLRPVSDAKMLMMVLLLPGGMLDGYAGDPDGVNGSWEKASTSVSDPFCVRVHARFSDRARGA
eukprot:COSAG02_NODE_909_length_16018_cov_15.571895_7_plen_70_part_00